MEQSNSVLVEHKRVECFAVYPEVESYIRYRRFRNSVPIDDGKQGPRFDLVEVHVATNYCGVLYKESYQYQPGLIASKIASSDTVVSLGNQTIAQVIDTLTKNIDEKIGKIRGYQIQL